MKFIFNLKVLLAFFLTSLQLMSMENPKEEKPTKFLFDAINYYEQGDFENAAKIFGRYAGKSVPIAEPFCLDLVKKGYLLSFDPVPTLEESGEHQKACIYFNASQQLLTIKHKVDQQFFKKKKNMKGLKIDESALKQNLLRIACLQQVQNDPNSPLLYAIGCLYESEDKNMAKQYFLFALTKNKDWRAIFGLQRVCTEDNFKKMLINNTAASTIYIPLKLMPILHQDEGETFAKMSGFFSDVLSKNETFLRLAAQFGHAGAQLLQGQYHCQNESQVLYWMMQCAGWNNIEALGACAHMMEAGKGTPINYERAYTYLKRATQHPEARGIDFFNFGVIHEHGKGTPVNNEVACQWYKKAHEASPDDKDFTFAYGRMLSMLGKYEEALPFLFATQDFSNEAMYSYGVVLTKLPPEKRDVQKAVAIFTKLASQGCLDSASSLVMLAVDKKIPHDTETLRIYKNYLEQAIEKEILKKESQSRNTRIANAYVDLRNLYITAKDLFSQGNIRAIHLSEKAHQFNPESQLLQFAYASDLKDNGQYEQALHHFLLLQKAGYPGSSNSIGACYDLLAKQSLSKSKVEQLVAQALKYYEQEVGNVDSPDRAVAAFNIYCLSSQERIKPLPNEELVNLLKIAADGGEEEAINDLGMAYKLGRFDLEPNLSQAEGLLKKAIEKGCWLAKINLMNMKYEEQSLNAKEEAELLRNELWNEHPIEFKEYLEGMIAAVEYALKMKEVGIGEDDDHDSQIPKEGGVDSSLQTEIKDLDLASSPSLEDTDYSEAKEDLQPPPVQAAPIIQNQEDQVTIPVLSKRQKEEQEEKERLQRKYERMIRKVESLRGKKQTKYRKIQTLINQHTQQFGGAVKNSKGSGRRVEINRIYSGFHQPHVADMKGGALKSMVNLMSSTNK